MGDWLIFELRTLLHILYIVLHARHPSSCLDHILLTGHLVFKTLFLLFLISKAWSNQDISIFKKQQ